MATHASPSAQVLWEVFLSSTIDDLRPWRGRVKDVLDKAGMACFPSENWASGHQPTLTRCRERFDRANAYVLLLGYWYGSIPPGSDRSVTHIEYDWALARWGGAQTPPMAVLMPAAESAADRKLRDAAERILADPKRHLDPALHAARLATLHQQATGTWKTITRFRSVRDLRENVLIISRDWKGDTPLAAARAPAATVAPEAERALSDIELGLLCREPQFDAIGLAIAEAEEAAGAPAVGLLVHGGGDVGQGVFLQRLVAKVLRRPSKCRGSLLANCHDPAALSEVVAQLLGLALGRERTPECLAALVAEGLKREPLGFVRSRCRVACAPSLPTSPATPRPGSARAPHRWRAMRCARFRRSMRSAGRACAKGSPRWALPKRRVMPRSTGR
jgi:hypothetical protein